MSRIQPSRPMLQRRSSSEETVIPTLEQRRYPQGFGMASQQQSEPITPHHNTYLQQSELAGPEFTAPSNMPSPTFQHQLPSNMLLRPNSHHHPLSITTPPANLQYHPANHQNMVPGHPNFQQYPPSNIPPRPTFQHQLPSQRFTVPPHPNIQFHELGETPPQPSFHYYTQQQRSTVPTRTGILSPQEKQMINQQLRVLCDFRQIAVNAIAALPAIGEQILTEVRQAQQREGIDKAALNTYHGNMQYNEIEKLIAGHNENVARCDRELAIVEEWWRTGRRPAAVGMGPY